MLVIAVWLWLTMFKQIRVARPAAEEAAPVETQRGHVKVLEPAAPPLALEPPADAEPLAGPEVADEEPLIPFPEEPPAEPQPVGHAIPMETPASYVNAHGSAEHDGLDVPEFVQPAAHTATQEAEEPAAHPTTVPADEAAAPEPPAAADDAAVPEAPAHPADEAAAPSRPPRAPLPTTSRVGTCARGRTSGTGQPVVRPSAAAGRAARAKAAARPGSGAAADGRRTGPRP